MDEGEALGVWLPKKPRRREEGSEAQWEGQSLKGKSYGAQYRRAIEKRFPLHPRTLLHVYMSHEMDTKYSYTSHMLGAGPNMYGRHKRPPTPCKVAVSNILAKLKENKNGKHLRKSSIVRS